MAKSQANPSLALPSYRTGEDPEPWNWWWLQGWGKVNLALGSKRLTPHPFISVPRFPEPPKLLPHVDHLCHACHGAWVTATPGLDILLWFGK